MRIKMEMSNAELNVIENRIKNDSEKLKDFISDVNTLISSYKDVRILREQLTQTIARAEELQKQNEKLQKQIDSIRGLL